MSQNRFGAGYQINLLSTPGKVKEIKAIVADYLPTGEIVGDNAGNLTVSISRSALRHVPNFLRQLNRDPDTLKEWGLSNSTLEEVFLRLATASKNVNEEVRVGRLTRQHVHTQPHTPLHGIA